MFSIILYAVAHHNLLMKGKRSTGKFIFIIIQTEQLHIVQHSSVIAFSFSEIIWVNFRFSLIFFFTIIIFVPTPSTKPKFYVGVSIFESLDLSSTRKIQVVRSSHLLYIDTSESMLFGFRNMFVMKQVCLFHKYKVFCQ